MAEVNFTDEFEAWFGGLSTDEQEAVAEKVGLLERFGVGLKRPHCADVKGSKHGGMRELRPKENRRQIRVFYAFDPTREAVLLIGGVKTDGSFYDEYVPQADAIFDQYLAELAAAANKKT